MQWSKGKNLGFSTAPADKLYLPVDPANDAPDVESEERDPNSLLNRTRKLIELKHTQPALAAYAEFVPLYVKKNSYPFIYARAKDKDVVLVILNPSGKESIVEFTLDIPYSKMTLLSGKEIQLTKRDKRVFATVPGQTYAMYELK
jgi:maltose alpha-D-glucosyltransferase/alpha-amylase